MPAPPRGSFPLVWGVLATLALQQWALCDSWQENVRPKLFAQLTPRDYQSFVGNPQLTEGDAPGAKTAAKNPGNNLTNLLTQEYFTTMLYTNLDQDILLIGARNILYKLNAEELRLTQTLQWLSPDLDRESCLVKGKNILECQNYVKVLQQFKDDPDRYMICGTNAFKPQCREYVDERGSYVLREEISGVGVAPFSHTHNSTAVLVGDELYAGTVADFTGVDPIIFRNPLRTQQYDSTQLNSPDFVGSFEHKEHVYYFFREGAVEHINCGKAIFSRVARVCKNDVAVVGPNKAKTISWISFLKARLNCSVPGKFPFYFDEIQSVTKIVRGRYGTTSADSDELEEVIYATFSTPVNSIGGSAVCAFRLKDIEEAFNGQFKEKKDMYSNWMPVPDHKVPSPRPGSCSNLTKSYTDQNLNFIKTHSLMDQTVQPFFGAPIVIRTGVVSKFTAIAVDPHVTTTNGKTYDVIFIGTCSGRVIKAINSRSSESNSQVETVIIEELQLFTHKTVIKDLKVMGSREARKSLGRLAVMTEQEIRSFPVQRCDRASNCQECVALQDPYCAWDVRSSRCGSGDWTANMASGFIQSIETGEHPHCPPFAGSTPLKTGKSGLNFQGDSASEVLYAYEHFYGRAPLGQIVNIVDDRLISAPGPSGNLAGNQGSTNSRPSGMGPVGPGVQVIEPSQVLFSLETLIITVSAGAVAALVVGFVTGYCCGRRCQKDSEVGALAHLGYPDAEYEYFEQRVGLARPTMLPGQHPGMGMPGGHMSGGQLLPSETAKLDNLQEEVTYAEPELVTGLSSQQPPMGSLINASGDMGGASFPNSRYLGGVGMGPPPSSSHYSSSLLNSSQPSNKFNTIHSSINKGGGNLFPMNHYESAGGPTLGTRLGSKEHQYGRLGGTGLPALPSMRESPIIAGSPSLPQPPPPPIPNSYHMSTLGRSSSMRTKDTSGSSSSNSAPNSNSSTEHHLTRQPQVVDSAYGTTRSSKKVYL